MRKFISILLLVNLGTLAYLIAGARRELPPLEDAFRRAMEAADNFKPLSPEQEIMVSVLKARIKTAESWSDIEIQEYERSELPLLGLTLLNIVGLFVIRFARKPEPRDAVNDLPAAPPDHR